ncbi:TonB-dependent receptor [Oceanicoccus sagamiensis]|uniref:TonB-dependent receptor n=1 Tax=Oceanicoccus sagamiensis TaxID=716816 RepID=A0A1X9NCD1_9GAMM|nr:TonB-dependent receptor [Oceanicoccus sagamiensis]ARN73199.1 hypothetical protein BST96_03205 [Oceanicoccus sagamiensis]
MKKYFPYIAVAISGTAVVPSMAQEGASLAIEEIIVTARKTEENLQSIPIALDAISPTMISERGISNVEDVAQYSAGLVFDSGLLPNDTRPVIRGLSSSRGRANVATLIDDVDVTSEAMTTGGGGITANLRLMDLERVEVVKGPQSVLYGRSAFSGAVNYVTKRPEQEFSGNVDVMYDEHDSAELRLGVTGGLTDTLAARVNLAAWDSDGWYEHPQTGGELNGGESFGGSLAFEWLPDDVFTAYTKLSYSDEEYTPTARVFDLSATANRDGFLGLLPSATDSATVVPIAFDAANVAACAAPDAALYADLFGASPACRPISSGKARGKESQIDLSTDPLTGKDFAGTEVETFRAHLDLRWEFEEMEFRSITAFTDNEIQTVEDIDFTDYDLIDPRPFFGQIGFSTRADINHQTEQLSQEFRVLGYTDNVDWFISALYWKEEMDTIQDDLFWWRNGGTSIPVVVPNPLFDPTLAPSLDLQSSTISRETEHTSIAASISYALSDDLSITIEGRYLEEDLDYTGNNIFRGFYTASSGTICNIGIDFPCGTSKNSVSESQFVPRASIDWTINDDALMYFTYSEGFKPGGITTVDADSDVSEGEFESEQLKSYELGAKTSWLDKSVFLNGAVFFYDYTDQQVPVSASNGAVAVSKVVNAGESELFGAEFDLTWQVTEGFSAQLGYVYSDTEYTEYNLREITEENISGIASVSNHNIAISGNEDGDFSGNQFALSAKHAATLSLRYEQIIASGMNGIIELNGSYLSKRYLSDGNNAYLPSHDIWSFQTGVDTEQWRVLLFVDNLLDDDTIRSATSNTDFGNFIASPVPGVQPEQPRAINARLPQPRTVGARFTYRF